jgi:hypothetical protein
MRRFGLIILVLFSIGWYSCGSSRKLHKSDTANSENALSPEDMLNRNKSGDFLFHNLSLKGDGKFQSKKEELTFTYRVLMVQDSLIWCSISKLGIEALRIQISPDSIEVLDRLNKRYAQADYQFLQGLTGMDLDFRALENLLTGNIVFVKDSLLADVKSKIPHRFLGKKDSTFFAYHLNSENFKVNRMEAENTAKNQKTFITYSVFKELSGFLIPEYILLTVVKPERNQLELTHTRIERDQTSLSLNFTIPESYARIRLR